MKAAAIDRFGPPAVLTLHTLPVPKPGPGQVLIALQAAGVGSWDASIRDGSWRPGGRPKFPLVPGTDGAGLVVAKGARARRFRIGDRVYANEFGCYAEYVAADVEDVGHVPPRLDLMQAGAAATTGLTALQGIDDALRVRRGHTVLIYGASGAVGTLAVQFAKRRGARVVATASGRDATALVRRLGADAVIDARRDDAIEGSGRVRPTGSMPPLCWLAATRSSHASISCVRVDESPTRTVSSPSPAVAGRFVWSPTMGRLVHASLHGWNVPWPRLDSVCRSRRSIHSRRRRRPTGDLSGGTSSVGSSYG
jgi:Zn-dependent alcohol dehydrogenase